VHDNTRADPVHLYLACRWHLSMTVVPAREHNTYPKNVDVAPYKRKGAGKEPLETKEGHDCAET
jgi:hypothetical protein